jgi:hypothetical protein
MGRKEYPENHQQQEAVNEAPEEHHLFINNWPRLVCLPVCLIIL